MRSYFADSAEEDFEIFESAGEQPIPLADSILKSILLAINCAENR